MTGAIIKESDIFTLDFFQEKIFQGLKKISNSARESEISMTG